MHPTTRPSDPEIGDESVHGVDGVEGVCPRGGGCGGSPSTGSGRGRSLSTGWTVWKESVHGWGSVEGVCPRGRVWRESVHGLAVVWKEFS